MPDHDPAAAGALAELDQLTDDYRRAENQLNEIRAKLWAAIVRHMSAGHTPRGQLAEHTPYDRNHVARIARDAGVPPQRAATVRSIKPKRK
jgi:hypothetical protein